MAKVYSTYITKGYLYGEGWWCDKKSCYNFYFLCRKWVLHGLNNFFIVFLESFFSMSDLDNGINVVTMSIMYMAFQSPTIISWLYMVNRGKIQTTCWYILEVTGGFLFTVWNKHDNTLCCGAFWFGTLFFNFAMPSKRRSKVVFQKVLFPRCYQPT